MDECHLCDHSGLARRCQIMTLPLLIDTDPGIDDALALLLAFRSPECSVEAITTVAGNVPVERCTLNALRVLEAVKPARVPPVGRGAGKAPPPPHRSAPPPTSTGTTGWAIWPRFARLTGASAIPSRASACRPSTART